MYLHLRYVVAPEDTPSGLLVFSDGKQQLWRLVPGGRALVRKPCVTHSHTVPTPHAPVPVPSAHSRVLGTVCIPGA